ncbi:maleylpyruvate isomerase family mycothiol-dependent enzyme [Actinopolymorpha sp. B9G3]|uniref:maleylpyruvate isomerase family mycothiol-dependent enzyme n=1 Tax=Actinopolymorpha sp. B9G3 TaxID=3158970 RepID=UPI0032D95F01
MTTDNAAQYDASRARIAGLVRDADPTTPVGACPGWTIGDLVAHLAGCLGDFLAGRFAVDEGDDFGERTVRERRHQSIDDSLAEWERNRATADETLAGPMGGVLVAEVISHEQDVRQAVGASRVPDAEALLEALVRPLQEIERKAREASRPAVRLVLDGEPRLVGVGEPGATLTVSAFDLLRIVGGRRSRSQTRELDWSGDDPEPYLDALTMFGGFRDTPLEE